jgi:hypothetical protein
MDPISKTVSEDGRNCDSLDRNTPTNGLDSKIATAIVSELHGLPLAIEQAGVLLKNVFSLSDFLAAYRAHYVRLMERYPPRGLLSYDKQRSIITVFDMLYCSIKEMNPEAAALLIFIAILGPWRIPRSLMDQFQLSTTKFSNPADDDTKSLIRTLIDPIILRLALNDLANVCLLKLKGTCGSYQAFSLHKAICEWSVQVIASEKQEWIIQAAHGLATAIMCPTERYVDLLYGVYLHVLSFIRITKFANHT